MRIKRLDLIKYGKFAGDSLDFQQSEHDFHVVVGPNEAGKSTVRNAVLELLFGMPTRTPLAFLHELTELRLGGVLNGNEGEEVTFHRARGRTQLRTPADEKLSDDYLVPLLGGASKEFFEQMFGLDHERLVEGGRSILDASQDLGRVLFQSSSGVGSLGVVRDALENRASELWAKRGSSNEYAQAETRFAEASTELKQTQVRTKVWTEAKAVTEKVDEEIVTAQTERQRLETLRSKLERIRRLAPMVRELAIKEAELAELGDVVDLPPSAYAHLNEGQVELSSAKRVLIERTKDLEARQLDRKAIATDDQVLALSNDIESLHEARGACLNHPRDLPVRRAEVERLLEEAFVAAAQLGWPTEEQALRDTVPGKLALKTVTNTLQNYAVLKQAVSGTQEFLEEKDRDLLDLRTQLENLAALEVPEILRQTLADAQAFKNSRAKQAALESDMEDTKRQMDEALLALGRFKNSVDALRAIDPPSAVRISGLQRQLQASDADVKNARDRLVEAEARLERSQLEAKHFTEGHKVVTHADVLQARAGRDEAWNNLKAGVVAIDAGASTIDAAIRLADELVDSELGGAQEAAKLQSIQQQAELAQMEVSRNQEALESREVEHAQHKKEWEQLMESAGLPGMALEDLTGWLIRRETVFSTEDKLSQCKRDLAIERSAYSEAVSALITALKAAGLDTSTEDLAALTATAVSFVRKADVSITQKESLEQQIAQAERAHKTLTAKRDAAVKTYEQWTTQWQSALEGAKLMGASTTLAQAASAVDLANIVSTKLEAAEEIRRNRIQTMQADLDKLEAAARHVCGLLDEELLKLGDWLEVARQLMARLHSARSQAQAAALADEALREARARKDEAELNVANTEARVDPMLKLAGVESVEQALPLAERSEKRRGLLSRIDAVAGSLLKDGDGLTREAIEAEVTEQDPASVVGMLEQAKRDLAEVNEQLNALAQQQVAAQQAFDAINGAANAATAEAKRQEALAAMGEIAEQYLEVATANRLLKWAIDRYRDQKQGPMLQRAGEVFAGLTLGQFARLVVDYEETPPALFAKRSNGKQVDVSGLSEGTRDQLFLALRIAALELHLQHSPSLPFIADDLFINFDDQRSKAGFEALKELSKRTQVIFLTHHDHLTPMIQIVFGPEVNMIKLEREARVA